MVDTEPEPDSEMRRRAAWLLVMLAVVAVLLIVVVSVIVNAGGGSNNGGGPGPLDAAAGNSGNSQSSHPHHHQVAGSSSSTGNQAGSSSTPPIGGSTSCPTSQLCILAGDPGNGIQAINDYRTQNGQPAVPGSVDTQAQNCALSNGGSGCSGGWAETWDSRLSGTLMAHKLISLGHLLDPMKSFAVGWAFDPKSKIYYFAIVRDA